MQAVAIIAVFLGVVATGLIMMAYMSQYSTEDIDCDDSDFLRYNYGSDYEVCYDDVEERGELASLMNGIGGALVWFSLILAISSNRLE